MTNNHGDNRSRGFEDDLPSPRYPPSGRCDSDVLSHNDRNRDAMKNGGNFQNYSRNFSTGETQTRDHQPLGYDQKSPTYSHAPSNGTYGTRSTDRTATANNRSQRASDSNTASTAAMAARKLKRLSFGMRSNSKTIAESTNGRPKQSMDYTFFRDPTPPPSDYGSDDRGESRDRREKAFGAGTAVGASEYDYRWDHVAPPAPLPGKENNGRICGMSKKTFIIVAIVALLLIIGVGVGAGVGVSMSSSSSSDDDDGGSDESKETATATSDKDEPTTTTDDVPRVTMTSRASCPAANNTEFLVPDSDKSFLRICGRDYSGQFGGPAKAIELGEVLTTSMEDCMIQCAGFPGCEGCGWGVIQGDKGEQHRCWLKAKLMKSHVARPGWDFAILQ